MTLDSIIYDKDFYNLSVKDQKSLVLETLKNELINYLKVANKSSDTKELINKKILELVAMCSDDKLQELINKLIRVMSIMQGKEIKVIKSFNQEIEGTSFKRLTYAPLYYFTDKGELTKIELLYSSDAKIELLSLARVLDKRFLNEEAFTRRIIKVEMK